MAYPQEILWIKQHKDILSLRKVADQIGIPQKNLWNYCNDVHSLNEMYWQRAVDWVRAFIKDSQPVTDITSFTLPEPSAGYKDKIMAHINKNNTINPTRSNSIKSTTVAEGKEIKVTVQPVKKTKPNTDFLEKRRKSKQ